MKHRSSIAFTLVELIVVITILAIMGTIAFISLGGYAATARESARISDMNTITKALNIYYTGNERYPDTASGVIISYSGSELWTQGYFLENVRTELRTLSEIPFDPVIGSPYVYSVTYNNQEFQLAGALENGGALGLSTTIPQSHALFSRALVKGNYNGAILGKEMAGTMYLFGVPSLITQSINSVDIQEVYQERLFVMDRFGALPPNFRINEQVSPKISFPTSSVTVDANTPIVYSGSRLGIATGTGLYSTAERLYALYEPSPLNMTEGIAKLTMTNPAIASTPAEQAPLISQVAQAILADGSSAIFLETPELIALASTTPSQVGGGVPGAPDEPPMGSGSDFLTEVAKIVADDVQEFDYFGSSVSISIDGNMALVGARWEDTSGTDSGTAYVFVRSNGIWTQQSKIQASDAQADDDFGRSLSLSPDGNMALVGARYEDTGGSNAGAAYIFTRAGEVWMQQAKIQASDAQAGDLFGESVAFSADGSTAIIGAYNEDTGGSNAGAAYIFTRAGEVWTQQAKIQASDAQASDWFGQSVALSADGNTALVGAKNEDTGGSNAGAAYIFTRAGEVWTQQAKIQASDAQASDIFGLYVSISADGNTALVGAPFEDTGGLNAGAAYIFTRAGEVWTQQAKIQASDAQSNDYFGIAALSSDGNTALIGADGEDTGGTDAGAAYIFTRAGEVWTQQAKIQAIGAQAGDFFGGAVSLSFDGSTSLIGAHREDSGGSDAGAAYVFE